MPPARHPLERQIVLSKQMPVVDAAHFIALGSVAESDAIIAVFDAKRI